MTDNTRALLKKLLITRYAHLAKRLEHLAGSKDVAEDALQETWLRLETMSVVAPVANAGAYLLSMATHAVTDRYRRERRHMHEEEVDELFQVEDELADPERIVAARRKIEALKLVLMDMTPRRRSILLAARVDGQLNREIAERFGISLRLVERELAAAMKHVAVRLEEEGLARTGASKGPRKF
jgi:RNA polymerase sigma factor (sigma-70 family)